MATNNPLQKTIMSEPVDTTISPIANSSTMNQRQVFGFMISYIFFFVSGK